MRNCIPGASFIMLAFLLLGCLIWSIGGLVAVMMIVGILGRLALLFAASFALMVGIGLITERKL